MPCTDGGPTSYSYENPETKRRLDHVTRLLCTLCKRLENIGRPVDGKIVNINFIFSDDSELSEWWENHKILDRKHEAARLAKEKAAKEKQDEETERRQLIDSLTPHQRKLLKLDKKK